MKKNKIIYCTYFDKGFLLKGLALHASLIRQNPKAELWILTFDEYTEKLLKKLKLKGVTVIPLSEFEDRELLAVKSSRHPVEYYWTCTPSWVLYIFKKCSDVDKVVYLDADMLFFADPDGGVNEINNKSLLIVEHRFPESRKILEKDTGRFNVAFNVFKRSKVGIKCLERWRKQCLDWCYWKYEDGKLGDQMYLDEWPKLYGKELVISKNVGVDTAPWNVSQYAIISKNGNVFINKDRLVCYHFHQFQILGPNHFNRVLGYTLLKKAVEYIYKPYEEELRNQYAKVKKMDKSFLIEKTKQDSKMLFRQKLAKYLGPAYWKVKSLLKWARN